MRHIRGPHVVPSGYGDVQLVLATIYYLFGLFQRHDVVTIAVVNFSDKTANV